MKRRENKTSRKCECLSSMELSDKPLIKCCTAECDVQKCYQRAISARFCVCDGDWRFVWSERYATMNNVEWFVLNEFGLRFSMVVCVNATTLMMQIMMIDWFRHWWTSHKACELQTDGRTPIIIIICMQNKLSLYVYVFCNSFQCSQTTRAKFPSVNTVHIDVSRQQSWRFSLCTDSTIRLLINRSHIFHHRALCF